MLPLVSPGCSLIFAVASRSPGPNGWSSIETNTGDGACALATEASRTSTSVTRVRRSVVMVGAPFLTDIYWMRPGVGSGIAGDDGSGTPERGSVGRAPGRGADGPLPAGAGVSQNSPPFARSHIF